jgi:hypothetical protein
MYDERSTNVLRVSQTGPVSHEGPIHKICNEELCLADENATAVLFRVKTLWSVQEIFQALMTHCNLEHIPQEDIQNFFYFVGKCKLDKEWQQNISKTKENFSVNEHILKIISHS